MVWELDGKAEHKRTDAFELWCWRRLASPLDCMEIKPVHPKGNLSWIFVRTDAEAPILWATWYKELTHLKRPWCWERLKVGKEGDDRGWDSWMAPPIWWIWIWGGSGNWWMTWRPGVLQSMGWQRVGHNWATELNWTRLECMQDLYALNLVSGGLLITMSFPGSSNLASDGFLASPP